MYSLTAPRNGAVLSYLIIDGDDVGGKVEAHLLANDVDSFVASSKEISASIDELVDSLNEIPGVYVVSAGVIASWRESTTLTLVLYVIGSRTSSARGNLHSRPGWVKLCVKVLSH